MKIGLDIHNVIDLYPFLFRDLSEKWSEAGHEIYIITGQEWDKAESIVKKVGIVYHHHYSIIDYHRKLGTHMWIRSDKEGFWMSHEKWICSKGEYAKSVDLDLHFDDYIGFAKYFPDSCNYVIVSPINFDIFYYHILKMTKQKIGE